MAEKITPRDKDYSQWYVDVVLKAKLADYAPVKGCMVIRPGGYALWERIREILDGMFKKSGHENAYFPLLIPESYIHREAEHVEGFSPELAVVTHAGGEQLEEPLVLRPTSETIIWSMYKKWIQSYRDLPILINQWANVLRWEKRTRLFLRTTEFLWQEGHTAHETREQAEEEAKLILGLYKDFVESYLAIPALVGRKSEMEKFAGAVETYTVEAMMQDKRALQAGTSHFLGQNFAKAFDVTFQNREGALDHVWATSWGVSTRLIGALIMTHSDDRGLVLPPKIAATEVVIVPIIKNESRNRVLTFVDKIQKMIPERKVVVDRDEQSSPGWKFAEWEMLGVPVRVEVGPRDVENDQVVLVRRDSGSKETVESSQISARIEEILEAMQKELLERARAFREENSYETNEYGELQELFRKTGGFVTAPWCGSPECELQVKEKTKATIRLLLDAEKEKGRGCLVCGKAEAFQAVFARAY